MKKFVMFDMDGVLFDTMPRHAKAWKQTMDELGVPFEESDSYLHEGRTGKGTIAIVIGPEADHVEIYKRKCAIFDSLPEGTVMPGAIDVLKEVKRAGAKATVVTGSGQKKTVERIINEFPSLFELDWMVTGNDVKNGKPDPEPYLLGLQKSGFKAEETIVVENAPLGIQSGHASGCKVIAVNTGPLDDKVLLDAGADILFHSMSELSQHIAEIINE